MNWIFQLDGIEIEEPVGFDSLELSITRDEKLHGVTFEASTSPLQFYGEAYRYLKNKKDTEGVRANVTFKAFLACDNYDYEEVLSGRLNFGKAKESCGDVCMISFPWEQDSCEVILKSRYDQKVDMDKNTAVDGLTPIPEYAGLSVETELPAHELEVGTEGYVAIGGENTNLDVFPPNNTQDFAIRPQFERKLNESINESQLVGQNFAVSQNGLSESVLSPVLLLDDAIDCFPGAFEYEVRLKGHYDFLYTGESHEFHLKVATGEFPLGLTFLNSQDLPITGTGFFLGDFDYTFSGTVNLEQGQGFYTYIGWVGEEGSGDDTLIGDILFHEETYIRISAVKACPATNAELYMVHETLSRASESITNGCVRVKSSYYGRTDSEPFSFPEDGCGGLRSVTSGLKIRQAVEDKFFVSLKDLVEGLNAIDNIGVGFEPDPDIEGRLLMRVEDLSFFYRDQELFRHDGIPKATIDTEEAKHYSRVDVGYKKWEVETVNGLDEFNSTRQYNTSIDTINSPLDITSGLVAGTYPIEITRQQSFATTGAADTKYDNETFILCMSRTLYPYGNLQVEMGNIDNPENMFSPSTIYNFRISPLRNLMRWYKTIAAGFASLYDSANKLFFSSGTGNLIAKGELDPDGCVQEHAPIQENQNLFWTDFDFQADFTPIWKNETITYEYPMSISEYRTLKADPYGYVSAQCGNGDFNKYWLKEIKFKLTKGIATFILRRKYGV